MNRDTIFHLPEGSKETTFYYDDSLPALPLPKLAHTLKRYFESLKPFGTPEELNNSKRVIEHFRTGVGAKLHAILEEKAKHEKNWVSKWWEDYAYLTLRMPLIPYCMMAQPLMFDTVGLECIPENFLKGAAICCTVNMRFWSMIRKETLRPIVSADKSIIFSSDLYKKLFNTCRIPGLEMDKIVSHFKTEADGPCPSHVLALYKGRIFKIEGLHDNGDMLSAQDFLLHFQQIQCKVDSEIANHPRVALLTHDDRTTWARNRNHLLELTENNRNALLDIESAISLFSLDTNCPDDYSDLAVKTLIGDLHSRWGDKSCATVFFPNGKLGCLGEHSCYDGSISMSVSLYAMLTLVEEGIPDWTIPPKKLVQPVELILDVDDEIRLEIDRMQTVSDKMQNCIGVTVDQFKSYGKDYIKSKRIHPDSWAQTALLLAYYRLHGSFAPTYETAMMRQFYKGRTETCRSCSIETVNFINAMEDAREATSTKASLFRVAANRQNELMNEARKGNGFDRHLFGLWCVAYDEGLPIPEFYDDPLYSKSGGGGNFILSTSTLGFTINCGFVAPMCMDGYGCFYSILSDTLWYMFSAYKDSDVTSCRKLQAAFCQAMEDIRCIMDAEVAGTKL
ncbi:peroxisomal carnitine O-octanoyltransferase [Topomyia yanbarensis]|uniref:peroxisomal carnitine O-octanoyltransferase n=1 Tax=Topomyia yanbarensis TaxID=2498891 RepID=UPI00273BC561|nr:peroxisomal carnitine O-octanoyltransferase [Topomyia yanbarensis]XP_058812659.1 peroxisomal carnitine O-octanoyltransferase [Topomyia yanbarensis]